MKDRILGIQVGPQALSVDYVYGLIRRLVEGVGNRLQVYPDIGFAEPQENRSIPADPPDVCKACCFLSSKER